MAGWGTYPSIHPNLSVEYKIKPGAGGSGLLHGLKHEVTLQRPAIVERDHSVEMPGSFVGRAMPAEGTRNEVLKELRSSPGQNRFGLAAEGYI